MMTAPRPAPKPKADKAAAFQRLYDQAHLAGLAAGRAAIPDPMFVQGQGRDENGAPIVINYPPVLDGVCGFAWVTIRPGTSSFARWLVKNGYGRSAYGGGVQVWVGYFNQSLTRKEAYASAFAKVLQEAGITAYSGSRID